MLHAINYSPYIVHKKNLTSKEANIRLKMNNEKENKKKRKKRTRERREFMLQT